ncbi:MAG: IclR family transcriptional regulator [Cutibacterium sp.]|nr:IclR family transcriptional regulator [Cutibacterium sp.]
MFALIGSRVVQGKVQTIQKAGRILNLFSVEKPEWGVSEVAAVLGLPKSSVSAMMSSLAEQGLLRRTGDRGYRLGWGIMAMSRVLLETTRFRDEARRGMEYLVSLFGETVHLATLERGQVLYVDKMQGTRAIQVAVTAVGGKFSAHASGVGKAILAYRPWEEVVEILEREGMPARTPNTITTLEEFREELERVRRQGYAHDIEEGMLELCCVAAPIRDHTGEVVASMSLSVPTYRFWQSEEKYRNTLIGTVRKVSENLGYAGARYRTRWRIQREAIGG